MTKQMLMSHPTWVRGLKLVISRYLPRKLRSHPTWVRGLKPMGGKINH